MEKKLVLEALGKLKEGKKIGVYVHNGNWQDIGRVADYEKLKMEMEGSK